MDMREKEMDGDVVYPLHLLDQAKNYRFLMSWWMNFDGILDATKLQESLTRLLEIGDWRKLGARLRYKEKDGRRCLECHAPTQFTRQRPAFLFHHTNNPDLSRDDHPAARFCNRLPGAPLTSSIDDDIVRAFLLPSHFPTKFEQVVDKDVPQISVHVLTFKDATIVLFMWAHVAMDGPGLQGLFRNWSLVLAGREADVAPFLGAKEDVVEQLVEAKSTNEEFILKKKQVGIFTLVLWMLNYLFFKPRMEKRTVFIPKRTYERILSVTRNDVADTSCHDRLQDDRPPDALEKGGALAPCQRQEPPFISDSDILWAWFAKAIASSGSKMSPITSVIPANPRYRLPSLRDTGRGVYGQNMTLGPVVTLSRQQVTRSVGDIALQGRQQLAEMITENQMMEYLQYSHDRARVGKSNIVVAGDPNASTFMFNNLMAIKVMSALDFSPALLVADKQPSDNGQGAERRVNVNDGSKQARGSLVNFIPLPMSFECGEFLVVRVTGRDSDGNVWLTGCLSRAMWARLEEDISRT